MTAGRNRKWKTLKKKKRAVCWNVHGRIKDSHKVNTEVKGYSTTKRHNHNNQENTTIWREKRCIPKGSNTARLCRMI